MLKVDYLKSTLLSHQNNLANVLIIAGSAEHYSSPIFNALGSEVSGASSITLFLPKAHIEIAKNNSLELSLKSFVHNNLGLKDLGFISNEMKKNDVLLVGSGIKGDTDTDRAINTILSSSLIPIVLCPESTPLNFLNVSTKCNKVILINEFEFKALAELKHSLENAKNLAKQHGVVVLINKYSIFITDGEKIHISKKNCRLLFKNGFKDALAGIIASLIAKQINLFESCVIASDTIILTMESISKTHMHYTTLELIKHYPQFLTTL